MITEYLKKSPQLALIFLIHQNSFDLFRMKDFLTDNMVLVIKDHISYADFSY